MNYPTCDCPTVKHVHGDYRMYTIHGCRCDPCAEDKRAYRAAARHLQKLGKSKSTRVPAGPSRERLKELTDDHLPIVYIAQQIGIDKSHLEAMRQGILQVTSRGTSKERRNVSRGNHEKIMGFQPPPYMEREPHHRIPADGTRRRLQALMSVGWPASVIASRMGVASNRVRQIMESDIVLVGTAWKVRDLYDELWDQQFEPTDKWGKIARTKTLANARSKGWPPPMFWDDDRIDDPTYKPNFAQMKLTRDAKRVQFIEEVEHLIRSGNHLDAVANRLGLSPEALEKRLDRYGRNDLMKQLGWAA